MKQTVKSDKKQNIKSRSPFSNCRNKIKEIKDAELDPNQKT